MNALSDPAGFALQGSAIEEQPVLSRLEWQVIALALREAAQCGCGNVAPTTGVARFFRRVLALLTGWEGTRPLADPRLETLRRFVCIARWRHHDAAGLAMRLVEQGFSPHQVRAVEMLIARNPR